MSITGVSPRPAAPPPSPDEARLADAVRQLEGVFVEQLFKAMRETVPTDGLTSGGAGEQMF
ncbi:MAG: flagellar biosynthesis protein FlgJ, partial [Gemmatimonadetes bacterium]|nr:flagellar biosynthesis protein FlgJ [Gemmatimonadota bacterium]